MKSKILSQLYNNLIGSEPTEIVELPASGSNRRYFRLLGNPSLIGVIGTCKEENETFIYLAKHFTNQNLTVPNVLIADCNVTVPIETIENINPIEYPCPHISKIIFFSK